LRKDQSLVGSDQRQKGSVFFQIKTKNFFSRPSEILLKNSKHTQKGLGYTVFALTAADWLSPKNLTKEGINGR
jgi:hypothetical protein